MIGGSNNRPRRPFWIKQAVRYCRRCGIAGGERVSQAPLGWYFDQTLKADSRIFFYFLFFEPDHFCTQNLLYSNIFWTPNVFGPKGFLDLNFLNPTFFWTKTFLDLTFLTQLFLDPTLLGLNFFWTWVVFVSKICWT